MARRTDLRRTRTTSAPYQLSPFANHKQAVPVVLITPHGIEHLSFTNGDRASITMKHDRLVVTVGDAE
jgi:hypothetical protein